MQVSVGRTLLVDDDPDFSELLANWLASVGVAGPTTVAGNGREALRVLAISREVPELVLLDLELPFVHGTEVLQYLRSELRFRHTVVVVTGSSGDPGRERMDFLPGEVWMPKPFGPDDLELAIRLARDRIAHVHVRYPRVTGDISAP